MTVARYPLAFKVSTHTSDSMGNDHSALIGSDGMRQTVPVPQIVTVMILAATLLYSPSAQAGGDPKNGKTIYEKHCVHCHGLQGKGDGSMGRLLKPPATDFTSSASRKKPAASLRQIIENGKPGTGMAPWKDQVTDADIADVLAYLAMLRR
jgi:mono/diheme cytochrome c family protein